MKHITLRRLRALALALGLVFCFGLFAGCSSQNSSTSQDPSSEVTESTDPSEEPSDTTGDNTAGGSTTGGGTDDSTADDTSGVSDVVGQVTAVDGATVTVQIYSAPEGTDIEDYGSVDMSQYSATEETDEVDLTDAMIGQAEDGDLVQGDASQIAVGDMLVLCYDADTGELLQAIIYPQSSGETGADA